MIAYYAPQHNVSDIDKFVPLGADGPITWMSSSSVYNQFNKRSRIAVTVKLEG